MAVPADEGRAWLPGPWLPAFLAAGSIQNFNLLLLARLPMAEIGALGGQPEGRFLLPHPDVYPPSEGALSH